MRVNNLFMECHSDNFFPNATFDLSIDFASKWECGGKWFYPYPTVVFREQYKNNMEFIWEATAEKGFYIGLTFQDRFFIEDSPGCDKDFLLVQQYTES